MSDHAIKAKKLVAQMSLKERMSQLLNASPAIERLGIPEYNWWNEALHGVARAGVATVFPQAIGLAATFDDELMYRVAEVISDEARAKYNEFDAIGDHGIYKGLTYWSPNINIFRDPRWGRGHETYGEDPYLTAKMATAYIKGLQGEDENYHKLDATLKHFAVHSGPEGIRHGFDAKVSQKDLFETYLWAFRYCIKNANPAAVMGAYNAINGEPCCGSSYLLKTILREELGFRGYVVSDCGAICDLHEYHHVVNSKVEAAALALNSGCDLNCGQAYDNLVAAFESGLIDEPTVTARPKNCLKRGTAWACLFRRKRGPLRT
jgi:beta-glucosidase